MSKEKKKQMGVLGLVIALVAVLTGGVLFAGAVSGWFDGVKVELSSEYVGVSEPGMVDLGVDEYGKLVEEKKSFVVLVDQGGCTTAERLKGYMENYAREKGIMVYKMMFEDMKETALHDAVRYYPSVAIVSKGRPVVWLRADADEDAEAYNNEEAFREWVGRYL